MRGIPFNVLSNYVTDGLTEIRDEYLSYFFDL